MEPRQTIITDKGFNAIISNGDSGPTVKVAYFVLGSTRIVPNNDTSVEEVPDAVYTGTASQITYQKVDAHSLVFVITLDDTVGDFDVGSIGLHLEDGTLFSLTSLVKVSPKVINAGDTKRFNILFRLDQIESIINLSLIHVEEHAIPEVQTENQLPLASLAPYPLYLVRAHTGFGVPTLASRYAGQWWFTPAQTSAVAPGNIGDQSFADGVVVGDTVYNNGGIWTKGDGTVDAKGGFGVRGFYSDVVMNGRLDAYSTLIPGQHYYAGVAGSLTNIPNTHYIGVAISETVLAVRAEYRASQPEIVDTSGRINLLLNNMLLDANVADFDIVYFDAGTNTWMKANGLDDTKGAHGFYEGANIVKVYGVATNTGWSLVTGEKSYANSSGGLTATRNNWPVGRAIDEHRMFLSVMNNTAGLGQANINSFGAVQLATAIESAAGLNDTKVISPFTLKAAISAWEATPAVAIAGVDSFAIITPATMLAAVSAWIVPATGGTTITGANTTQYVTPAGLLAAIVAWIVPATNQEALDGVNSSKYVSPSVLKYALDNLRAAATISETRAGVSSVKYVSPATLKDAIDTWLQAANTTEARTGVNAVKYISPASLKDAVYFWFLSGSGPLAADLPLSENSGKIPNTSWVQGLVAQATPPGSVLEYFGATAPTGYLKANGAAISRTTYAALFAAIGTVFGVGDGTTTFNLPDSRGVFLRGWDDGRGYDAGRAFGTYQTDAMQGHRHEPLSPASTFHGDGSGGGRPSGGGASFVSTSTGDPVTNTTHGTPRTANETRPKNLAVLVCIKY